MHEFAWGGTSINPHYGTPRNPWDRRRIAGGSSGGSAAAVAASLAAGSLGTDTGGSVRIPAALSGVVGLKPTYGRVSRAGVYPLCWSLDHVGPIARTVRDAALLLEAIAGRDPRDPTSSRRPVPLYSKALTGNIGGVRIGVPRDYFFDGVEPQVEATVRGAISHLRHLGGQVEEVSLPLMRSVPGGSLAIMVAEAYAVHERYVKTRARDYGEDVRQRLMLGMYVSAPQYLKALRFRELLRRETLSVLRAVDVLAVPTAAITAKGIDEPTVRIGEKEVAVASVLSRFTRPFNMTGLPALSLPAGFAADGMPVGLQIVGRPFEETTVLRVADAYERSTPWHERRPNLTEQ
jgi:aspartyl-tRNA(Asn)/glutamyl-tRNA(Gln) amidotransferase subunit A